MPKVRADQLLVDRALAESRAKAQALILAGLVFSGERKIEKAGQAIAEDAAFVSEDRNAPGYPVRVVACSDSSPRPER